jgi:hypothetical protein
MTESQPISPPSLARLKAFPEFIRRHKNIILASSAIFLISILYNLTFNRIFILDIDEAHLIKRIMAVLTGEIPLIDFKRFTYAPGRYWFFGFLFKILGPSLALERFIWVVFRSLVNVFSYLVARVMIPRYFVLIPVLLSMTMACVPFKTLFPFLTLLNLFTLFGYIKTRERKWLIISGLTAGMTIWVRQDISGFLFLAASLCFFFQHASLQRLSLLPPRIRLSVSFKPIWKKWRSFLTALAIPFLPLVVIYGIHGAAHTFVWDMFIRGPLNLTARRIKMSHHFPDIRTLFQTPVQWDVFSLWIPVFIFISILVLLFYRLIKQHQFTKHDLYLLATLVMAVLTFNQTFQFAIFERFLENAAPVYILVGYIIARTYRRIKNSLDFRLGGKKQRVLIKGVAVIMLLSMPAAFIWYGLTQKNVNDRLTYKRRPQEIVRSDSGVWLVKGQLHREIRGVRRAIAKGSHKDDQIVFINTALIFYHGTKRGLANYEMHVEPFKEDNLSRYFQEYNPEYVAVENWALKYFRWLSPSFRRDFERDYTPIAIRAGHTVFIREPKAKVNMIDKRD